MLTSTTKNIESFDSGTLLTKHTSITTLSSVERVIDKYFSEVSDNGLELKENDYFNLKSLSDLPPPSELNTQ